jgi:hypothetical protein
MPVSLRNRKLKIEFFANIPTTADGVWRLSLYDSTGTRVALSTDSSSITTLPGGVNGKFVAYFDATDSATYSLRLTQTTRTNANTLYVTNVIVGPGIQPQGAVVGEWQSYTPTVTGVTTNPTLGGTFVNAVWRRVGSNMEIQVRYTQIAAGTAGSGTYAVTIPSGYTIDSSKINIGASDGTPGFPGVFSLGTSNQLQGYWFAWTTTSITARIDDSVTGTTAWSSSSSYNFGTGVLRFGFVVTVPIAEWAGSGTVNVAQNDVEYAATSGTWDANSSTTVYGPAGALMGGALTTNRAKTVTFQTPVNSTDALSVEVSEDGVVWYTANGFIDVSGSPIINSYSSTGAGNNSSGVYLQKVAGQPNQVSAFFFRYAALANDDLPAVDWKSTWYWRVKKISGGAAVGFGLADEKSAGLVSTTTQTFAGVKTFQDGALIKGAISLSGTGYVGEVFGTEDTGTNGSSYYVSSTTAVTAAAAAICSLTLNKGIYFVSLYARVYQTDGAARAWVNTLRVGGGIVSPTLNTDLASGTYNTISWAAPIIVTADSTVVAIYSNITSLTGSSSGNQSTLSAIRIA